ncbi:MAG: ATP-binding protein [bacterium]
MNRIKESMTTSHIFALIMAIIIMLSMGLTFIIIYLLMRFNYSPLTGALTSSVTIALLVILVGIVISTYVSKKILRPILKLNDAAMKVAMGDFSVRLEEKSIAKEIKQIEENFNIMVKELSNIETLRNDFVSNVSHEFKTPLSAISGYTTLLKDETLSSQEADKYLQYIMENTERLTKLTQNILSLSRLENQGIVPQKEWFLLDEQIRRVLLNYESIWEEKNLSIDLNMENITYYGSKPLLAQVWSNLIDNAIKFSNQNGMLSIDCRLKDKKILISIKDSGIGMGEEEKRLAFDKFYQGELSHSRKGNGLGLPLVKRIVTLCGGTISLESEKEIGTEVTVTLEA